MRTREEEPMTVEAAVQALADYSGRSVFKPDEFAGIVHSLGQVLYEQLPKDHDAVGGDNRWYYDEYLAGVAEMAGESRAMTACPAYQPVVGVDDLSKQIIRDLGGEASTGKSVGHGSAADEAHEENMKRIAEKLDVDLGE